MARIVGQANNTAIFNDNLSGDGKQIHIYYRHPTTEERASYTNNGIQRLGDEVVIRKGEARMESGLKLINGFRFGDFLRSVTPEGGGEPELRPFSHEPSHPDYVENWRELLMEGGADLVELLAARLFDMPCQITTRDKDKEAAAAAKKTAPEESAGKN